MTLKTGCLSWCMHASDSSPLFFTTWVTPWGRTWFGFWLTKLCWSYRFERFSFSLWPPGIYMVREIRLQFKCHCYLHIFVSLMNWSRSWKHWSDILSNSPTKPWLSFFFFFLKIILHFHFTGRGKQLQNKPNPQAKQQTRQRSVHQYFCPCAFVISLSAGLHNTHSENGLPRKLDGGRVSTQNGSH